MGTRLHLIVDWFHWKLHTKKEGNCSGRSRVRRILLTCIQMLLIQFLEVIWSMPKNFAFFQKPQGVESEHGVSITNSTALSNAFNYHFSTIGFKLASEIPFNNGSSFQEYISGLSERFQLVSTDSNQVFIHSFIFAINQKYNNSIQKYIKDNKQYSN